ncbi:hypothetical protein JTB14_024266 [Gonioctena quinquepunctata]|nr:hypothetical protein JTB14_024266 [Gonioctena quinquepunctata]
MNALEPINFTMGVQKYLKSFENSLLDAMNKDGWDGIEDENKVQWTLTGSLFYSIIVITTIDGFFVNPIIALFHSNILNKGHGYFLILIVNNFDSD